MRRQRTFQAGPLRGALEAEQHTSASARFIHKAHCVLMVMSGMNCCGVVAMFGESARSVERWVRAYEQGGIEGLKNKLHRGRPARQAAVSALAARPAPRYAMIDVTPYDQDDANYVASGCSTVLVHRGTFLEFRTVKLIDNTKHERLRSQSRSEEIGRASC